MLRRALPLAVVLGLAGCDNGPTGLRPVDPPTPSSATLTEARQLDQAQRCTDDGQFDQARTLLDRLIAHGCQNPQAFMLRARLAFQQGEFEAVIPWTQRAITGSPLWIEPRVLQAEADLKLKHYTAAMAIFAAIDRMAPDQPWGPYGMGSIAAMEGDLKTAVTELDLALARDPQHAPSLESRAGVARLQGQRDVEEHLLLRYVTVAPLDADAWERLAELARSAGRLEDARQRFERSYQLEPTSDCAKALAELAQLRGDHPEAQRWATLAGIPSSPAPAVQAR